MNKWELDKLKEQVENWECELSTIEDTDHARAAILMIKIANAEARYKPSMMPLNYKVCQFNQ